MLAIVKDACLLETYVPDTGNKQKGGLKPLLRQGAALSSLYAAASRSVEPEMDSITKTLVQPGNPLILVELERREPITLPPGFVTIDPSRTVGVLAGFGRLDTKYGIVNIWILQPGASDVDKRRSLRLCLLRLHAEQEALDLVLKQLKAKHILYERETTDDLGEIATELDEYLNKAVKLIRKETWSGISQSAILEAADAAELVTPDASRKNLIERFEGARRQVLERIQDYQIRRAAVREVYVTKVEKGGILVEKRFVANVTGGLGVVIVNVAEFMENVTNNVNQNLSRSSAPSEALDLVKKLGGQIEEISSKIDPGKTQHMGSDLQTLSQEMTQSEPRAETYKFSLENIKNTATSLGEIAGPILTTIGTLKTLLLGV
jgi:hypothetical protein